MSGRGWARAGVEQYLHSRIEVPRSGSDDGQCGSKRDLGKGGGLQVDWRQDQSRENEIGVVVVCGP